MSTDDGSSVSTEEDESVSSSESSQNEQQPQRGNRQRSTPKQVYREEASGSDDDEDEDEAESSESEASSESPGPTRRRAATSSAKISRRSTVRSNAKVNYRDESSEAEEEEEGELVEWDEPQSSLAEDTKTETIERILRHRRGAPGAVGPATAEYNLWSNPDPNASVNLVPERERELQFLIKWVGWSHWHNTWESHKSLEAIGFKGAKKLENYIKKMMDMDKWRRSADKEYVEFYDYEQEMNEELLEQYKVVERIIGHQKPKEDPSNPDALLEYLVKWSCLPYSDATWEDESLILRNYSQKIDEYMKRVDARTIPSRGQTYKRRPKFMKLENMPEYLKQINNPEAELRDYQLEGLNWLLHAWSKGNSCILADEMGLGKTIQSISFLSSLFHIHEMYGPYLVVVPLSTMAAWQREFESWAPDMNVVTYMGDVNSRDRIREFELYRQGTKKLQVNAFLTTYEILLKDKAFLGTFTWSVLMVDEAHRLKNNDSQLYQCLFDFSTYHRVLITGTPLQNSMKELWALLHFIMPDKFDSWEKFELAHEDQHDHKEITALHRKLQPYLLRRVKKDVEKSLPAKVEQILRVDMTKQQKQFYKLILTRNYEELSKGVKGSINGFINVIMELKKCCNHSSLVRNYDHIQNDAQARLQQLLKSSGKLILLDKLLCRLKDTGHRVLIFSQMVMMLDILQEYLQLRRFSNQRLDGSMRSDLRKQALDHFNAEGSQDFCFLLSTRAGGLGINLATADTVIIFDSDWNPQNDLQAMSRAHRIGQKKQVNIYRLVTRNSVEENIVERAKQKLVLDHLIIQRMDTTGRTVLSKTSSKHRIPFDKSDINVILKFGAEELFREKEDEEQELEVDIDDILSGAETRECDNVATDNELLNSFKYTNFVLDEEKDLAMLNPRPRAAAKEISAKAMDEEGKRDWDDILPKGELDKIKEEQWRKQQEELYLGPRQRTKVNENADATNEDGYVEKKKRGKRKKNAGEEVDGDADYAPIKKKRGRKKKTDDENGNSSQMQNGDATGPPKSKKRKTAANGTDDPNQKQKKPRKRKSPTKDGVVKDKKEKKDRKKEKDRHGKSNEKKKGQHEDSKRHEVSSEHLRIVRRISFNLPKYKDIVLDKAGDYFGQVVDTFRPVSKHLKRLVEVELSSPDGTKSLQKVGDFIVGYVIAAERKDRWFNFLWIFISQFFNPVRDPHELFDLYMSGAMRRSEHHHHRHKDHHHNGAVRNTSIHRISHSSNNNNAFHHLNHHH